MIERKTLPAMQVVPLAPWQIRIEVLESDPVKKAVKNIKDGVRIPQAETVPDQQSIFSAS